MSASNQMHIQMLKLGLRNIMREEEQARKNGRSDKASDLMRQASQIRRELVEAERGY